MIKNGHRLYHRVSCYSTSKYQSPNKLLSNSLYRLGIFKKNSIINTDKQIKACYVLKSVLIENSSWITFYLKNHSRSKTVFSKSGGVFILAQREIEPSFPDRPVMVGSARSKSNECVGWLTIFSLDGSQPDFCRLHPR